MFGLFDKKEGAPPVGAKEKRARAAMLLQKKGGDEIKSKREGRDETNPAVTGAIIYVLSVGLAWFLSEGPWKNGAGFKTGHDGIDALLSVSKPHFVGDTDIDYLLLVMLRALVIFLAAALLPGITYLWIKLTDKADLNVYRSIWGVTVGAPFVIFFFKDGFFPILGEVFAGF